MTTGVLRKPLRKTLAIFSEKGAREPMTTNEVAARFEISRRSVFDRLQQLVEKEFLETKKVGASGRIWWQSAGKAAVTSDGDESTETESVTEEFNMLIEAVDEYAACLLDREGRVASWNIGAKRLTTYSEEEILGSYISEFYTEEDREADLPNQHLSEARTEGTTENKGWRVRRDGSRFLAHVKLTERVETDGTHAGYTMVIQDLTERQRYEKQLQEEKAFTESLLDNQRDIVYVLDREGQFTRWNDQLGAVTGYTDDEIKQMHPIEFVADEAAEKIYESLGRVLEGGESTTAELPLVTADGTTIPYEMSGTPIRDEKGAIIGLTGIGRDISERKAKERQLRRQRDEIASELDDIFTRIDDGFLAVDEEFRFTHINERAEKLLNHSEEELLGRRVWDVFPEAAETPAFDAFHRALETQEQTEYEFFYEPLDFWVEAHVYPSENGLSVYFQDITERKERERQLEQSEQRYRTLAEYFPNGIVALFDENLQYTLAAGQGFEDIPPEPEDLEGRSFRDVWDEDTADALEPAFQAVLGGEHRSVELTYLGREWIVHAVPISDERGDVFSGMTMAQDITEQKQRERELERRIHQQEAVTELGQRALEERDVDSLMAEAATLVADSLDNKYCKVLDFDSDDETLLLKQGVGWNDGIAGSARVSAVADDSQASYTLATNDPVVVSDLSTESRFSGPELLTSHEVKSGISVIIGSTDDPWGILGTHDTEKKEFTEHDVNFVHSIANILATAITRHEDERALIHQREQLAALNDLNRIVRRITDAVIDQSTRTEIEQTVCEHLAESESYCFAWIGDIDHHSQDVTVRANANDDGYVDEVTISTDPSDQYGCGPTGRALRSDQMQTITDIHNDPEYEPWRDLAEEYGFRSSAAIPIVYDETGYGVLNVYAERSNAFEGQEQMVLSQLGEVIGHAITAVERKRALMSDDVVELQFRMLNLFDAYDVDTDPAGTITITDVVPIQDDQFLLYGEATAAAIDGLSAFADVVPQFEEVRFQSEEGDTGFEIQLSEPPILSTLASMGGSLEQAVIEDGNLDMTAHLAPSADIRQFIETVRAKYPNAEMLSQRQVTRVNEHRQRLDHIDESLTDRQQTALRAAFHSGFFEWPRDVSGEDVADSLGVAPPTFHQHLRRAEKKIFDALLASTE